MLRAQKDETFFIDRMFGFTAQQAAEKILKAHICLSGLVYPYTHDLGELFDTLEGSEVDLTEFRAGLVKYTAYAGGLRYEPDDLKAEPLDRDGAIALVEALLEGARRRLAEIL